MGWRGLLLVLCFAVTLFISLNSFTAKPPAHSRPIDEGRELFIRYCGLCHAQPDPQSLTKQIWKTHVLPVMASRMGIIYPGYDPLRGLSPEEKAVVNKNGIIPEHPMLSQEDWDKLERYIVSAAPDSLTYDESRIERSEPLEQFTRKNIQIDEQSPSMITGLEYNPTSHTLWISNMYNKVINWNFEKGITKTFETASPVVDFNFYQNKTYLTQIGKLYPTELSTGSFAQLDNDKPTPVLTTLHRPVHTEMDDLDGDGIPELVVCNFGNKTGSLSLFKKDKAGDEYKEDILSQQPGAIICFIRDMDGDGKKDIVAMFSQGDESVHIYYQKDKLKFKDKRVLRFPPNYGTTDMVLTDYDHDGQTDIITVHGDNADYSNILKPYHGIRLNLNDGKGNFKEKFFFPMYGVTRVLAEDFDDDGDIDLAASAFFPDFGKLISESFIYLENTDSKTFSFKPYTLAGGLPIKSLTLEKADVDGDGDMDILLGNFAQSPGAVPAELDAQWKNARYGLILLENKLHQPKKELGR
ncbi:FG-GAP repeat domain-containing protein [Mucilaginibacter pedocola]|uniref:Cytochrome c domain-containing protein n=1 Tax=Mucilaginibacter pedocola TaxID=1792845 RepID=A0A1S9P7U3_9SPHI|nr:VCBS repeat-containing protein [Mucilaginibacter pedocola]OOQ57021.1 hypothetical protein BC343_15905 [Mucilaginibacter pedocola]